MKIKTLTVKYEKSSVVHMKIKARNGNSTLKENFFYVNGFNDHVQELTKEDFNAKITNWVITGRELIKVEGELEC